MGIAIAATAVLEASSLSRSFTGAAQDARLRGALLGGLLAALATAVGALPVLLSQRISERSCDLMLGFGAGVMLAACSFSLIGPALEAVRERGGSSGQASAIVGLGVLAGAVLLLAAGRLLPVVHADAAEALLRNSQRRVWLFVAAITLHNLPEGLAIGVAYAGAGSTAASVLSASIAIQDVPEGMAVALALRSVGYGRAHAVAIAAFSGMVEPLMALAGVVVVSLSATLLPWGLSLAAGAMLHVICHEIIPESHRKGHEAHATTGLMLGFVLMMVLDTALG